MASRVLLVLVANLYFAARAVALRQTTRVRGEASVGLAKGELPVEIATELQISRGDVWQSGTHAEVYLIDGGASRLVDVRRWGAVIVKVMNLNDDDAISDATTEVSTAFLLRGSTNIARLHGFYCTDGEDGEAFVTLCPVTHNGSLSLPSSSTRKLNAVYAHEGELNLMQFLRPDWDQLDMRDAIVQRGVLANATTLGKAFAAALAQGLQGLRHLHEHGLVHGDLHLGQFFLQGNVADEAPNEAVRLGDFGACLNMSQESMRIARQHNFEGADAISKPQELVAIDLYALRTSMLETLVGMGVYGQSHSVIHSSIFCHGHTGRPKGEVDLSKLANRSLIVSADFNMNDPRQRECWMDDDAAEEFRASLPEHVNFEDAWMEHCAIALRLESTEMWRVIQDAPELINVFAALNKPPDMISVDSLLQALA